MFRNCSRFISFRSVNAAYTKYNVSSKGKTHTLSKLIQICQYSSSSAAKIPQKDKFQDLIDELVEQSQFTGIKSNNNGNTNKFKHLESIDQIKNALENARPANAEEVLQVLMKLNNLFTFGNHRKEVLKYLTSDECSVMLYAQLLSEDVKLETLLESATIVVKLYHNSPQGLQVLDSASITPRFEDFYTTILNNIIARLSKENTDQLSAEMIVSFYCKLLSSNVAIPDQFKSNMEDLVIRKVSEIHQPNIVVSLLKYIRKEQFSQIKFISPIFSKVEELVPVMLLGELINVFSTLASNNCRPNALLQIISEGIRNHTEIMVPRQIVRLGNAIRDLSFYNPRLISRYCNDLSTNIAAFTDMEQMTSVISMLTKGKVTSEKTWKLICNWLNGNHKKINPVEMKFCIGALAAANVDPNLVKPFIKPFAASLQPSWKESPKKWLSLVWSLAVLESLTPKLADSVLNNNFEKALLEEIKSGDEEVFNIQKLYQVNSAAKFDLKNYRGSMKDVNRSLELNTCKKLKYGKSLSNYENFLKTMYIIITPDCRRDPNFYPEAGTFIDVLTVIDPETKKFVPLNQVEKNETELLKECTAILYFDNQFSRIYSDDDGSLRRLPGQFQMNIRHLLKAGIKVCVITEHDLQKCEDMYSRVVFMKQMIAEPKDIYYYAPNWSDLK